MRQILILLALGILSLPLQAYIGPGLGAGVIGVITGIIGSIFLAFMAIFWYPIKRLLKKKRRSNSDDQDQQEQKEPREKQQAE